jgi:hypothetical protein
VEGTVEIVGSTFLDILEPFGAFIAPVTMKFNSLEFYL